MINSSDLILTQDLKGLVRIFSESHFERFFFTRNFS